jgi:hypothetical protein
VFETQSGGELLHFRSILIVREQGDLNNLILSPLRLARKVEALTQRGPHLAQMDFDEAGMDMLDDRISHFKCRGQCGRRDYAIPNGLPFLMLGSANPSHLYVRHAHVRGAQALPDFVLCGAGPTENYLAHISGDSLTVIPVDRSLPASQMIHKRLFRNTMS